MELEITEVDRKAITIAQDKMVQALLTVPPIRLRLLARWFEQSEFVKEYTDVQDDLRKMADLSEEALKEILKNRECGFQLE